MAQRHHPVHTRVSFAAAERPRLQRSEEHTSELQSQSNLVCRLLLEKKKMLENRRESSEATIATLDQRKATMDDHGPPAALRTAMAPPHPVLPARTTMETSQPSICL